MEAVTDFKDRSETAPWVELDSGTASWTENDYILIAMA
jgi:hypothetical protein